MSVDTGQVPYEEFISNEITTLGFLRGFTSITSDFPKLYSQADLLYNQYKDKQKNEIDFIFDCEMEMEIEGREKNETLVFIEACVRKDYSEATYALTICENQVEPKKMIRKFHFDYDPQLESSTYKKPKYHLQYGGTETPKICEHGISMDYTWLSVPRLIFAPINLALLLDFVFIEFPSEETNKITEKREWRKLIKSNEDKILKDYYANLNTFMTGNHSSDNLLREYFYG